MIITIDDFANIRARHSGKRIVLTSGTFDLLHAGHLNYLEQVKQHGDIVVVMLSGDKRVKTRKGSSRPIISESERARLLDALKTVDYVFIDPSELSPNEIDPIHAQILDKLQPDYYVTDGPDQRFINLLDKSKFIILKRMNSSPSTTEIIGRIRKGEQ